MKGRIYQVDEKPPLAPAVLLSLQHLFAMFGASVLVPMLFKIDIGTVLLFNGVGTLLYIFICNGKVPAFLGSSFAFISPALLVINSYGYDAALGGFVVSGVMFVLVSLAIRKFGFAWIDVVFPPAAMGAVVAIIGLELAPVAGKMAGITGSGTDPKTLAVSMVTFAVVTFGAVFFRGFLKVIPVLIGIAAGYLLAFALGMVSFSAATQAPLLKMPAFSIPVFLPDAILIIIPAAFVVIAEHIGHFIVTENIVGRELRKDPGLHRSMLGDGISTMLSGLFGSVPTTTYGENIGVMAITRVYSVWVIGGAAVISVCLAFMGQFTAIVNSIPVPVMGGVSLLLFGVIAASGVRMLVESKVDYSQPKNIVLTSVVLVVGLSGASINIGSVELKGMALATLLAILVSLVFSIGKRT
jgi:uracil permease